MNTSDVDAVFAPLRASGAQAYLGESITVREHSLQCALFARNEGANDALVAAALLHDVGWLLKATDRDHAEKGAAFLRTWFGPEVTEPIALHVGAKRYLCAEEPSYYETLSPASQRTLALQGGVMAAEEKEHFLEGPFALDAITLRRFDDGAKVVGLDVPGLETYLALIEGLLV